MPAGAGKVIPRKLVDAVAWWAGKRRRTADAFEPLWRWERFLVDSRSYQCSETPAKLPQALEKRPPVQSCSVPNRDWMLSGETFSLASLGWSWSGMAPEPMRVIDGSAARMAAANSLCLIMKIGRASCRERVLELV